MYEKNENEEEKNNFIDLRDSMGDLLLNVDLYSLKDEQIIINFFSLIEQIILNSNDISVKFFSIKTLEKISSFAQIVNQFNKNNQRIYLNFFRKFLQIYSEQNQDQQIFNKLIDYIITSPDPYLCNVILNILSFHEFVKKIPKNKIEEIGSYLNQIYERININIINQSIYMNMIKLIINYLIYVPIDSNSIEENPLIIYIMNANFNLKLNVFSNIFFSDPNLKMKEQIPKEKSNIILIVLQAIFLNFEENDNPDIIIKFIFELSKYSKINELNFDSLYDIFFVKNKELTGNIFYYLQKNSSKINLNILNFIYNNLLEKLLINKPKSFLYPFCLKCLKEDFFNEGMELIRKIIYFLELNTLNENLIYNYIEIIKLFEKYLNLLTSEIPFEDNFISVIEKLFSEIEKKKFYCQILVQNDLGIKKPIFERIYNIFYKLFEKSSNRKENLEKSFNLLFLKKNKTIFYEIDYEIKKNIKKLNKSNIKFLTKINYSLYFFTKYCVHQVPINNEKFLDNYFQKLFTELQYYNLTKNHISNINEIKYYNEIKNEFIKNRSFIDFKSFVSNKITLNELIISSKDEKKDFTKSFNLLLEIKDRKTSSKTFSKTMNFEYPNDDFLLQNKNIFCHDFQSLHNKDINSKSEKEEIENNSFENLNENIIINPKRKLLLINFAIYFQDIYFYDQNFKNLKDYFKSHYACNKETKLLNYPSKIKNFSNIFEPRLFLKKDFNFFTNKYFSISHDYFITYLDKLKYKTIPFYKKPIQILNNNEKYDCELINIKYSLGGIIHITHNFILFESAKINYDEYIFSSDKDDRINKNKKIIIYYSEIEDYIERVFLFNTQAIEFFLKDGKSYFFNLMNKENLNNLISFLNEKIPKEKQSIRKYSEEWNNSLISTFNYLCKINYYSSRSYNNTTQYPIFPWITKNLSKIFNDYQNNLEVDILKKEKTFENIIEEDQSGFRTFKYPISVQTKEKRNALILKYISTQDEEKYHHYSHFSTFSYIYYYLMRLNPYTYNLIKLQGNEQENVNRMFNSIEYTQKIIELGHDNRELIPEFYYNIEYFFNLNCVNFGKNIEGKLLDDVIPIDYINKNDNNKNKKLNALTQFVEYIIFQRKMLDSFFINSSQKDSIVNWIDNVFGKYQFIENEEENENKVNSYPFSVYKQKCPLNELYKEYLVAKKNNEEKKKKEILKKFKNSKNIMINFGMMPLQIFDKLHLIRNINVDNSFEKNYSVHNIQKFISTYRHFFFSKDIFFIVNISNNDIIFENKQNNKNNNNRIIISPFDYNEDDKYQNLRYVMNFSIINYIFICRYKDNSIRIININENKEKKIICEDYVNSISTCFEKNFVFLGLKSGKLEKYIFMNDTLIFVSSILAHFCPIEIIEINIHLNIILTSGKDNLIYIRKLYDFELLTKIEIPFGYNIKLIKMSSLNFIYILCDYLNKDKKIKSIVFCYTVTGLKFKECKFDTIINNICFTKYGDLILGFYDYEYLCIVKGSNLSFIKDKLIYPSKQKPIRGSLWFEKSQNKTLKLLFCLNDQYNYLYEMEGEEEWEIKS